MWYTPLSQLVFDNAGVVFAGAVIVTCLGTVFGVMAYDRRASIKAYWEHRRSIRMQRGLVMGRKKKTERQAYVKGLFSDVLTHGLEEAWFAGKITREEVNALYRAIGKTHNMPDLIPVLTPAALRSAIKSRKALGIGMAASPAQDKPAWGEDPPKAAKIVVDDTNVIQAAKKFGAKALAKLQTQKKTA